VIVHARRSGVDCQATSKCGESGGQDGEVIGNTQQVNIRKVWQKVSEGIESLTGLVASIFLRPLKPLESVSERGEDSDEDSEGYTADADVLRVQNRPHV
jgi:hypothetical protein